MFNDTNTSFFNIGGLSGSSGSISLTGLSGNGIVIQIGTSTTNAVYSGSLTDAGGVGAGGITVTAGTQTLSGVNTYSGPTKVTGGTLALTQEASLYNGVINSTTASYITLQGGTLACGSAARANSRPAIWLFCLPELMPPAAPSASIRQTSREETLTYSSAIGGAIGLAKLGTGTLVLSQTNSYSGPTSVSSGALTASATNALGASSSVTIAGTLNIGTFNQSVGGLTLTSGTIAGTTGVITVSGTITGSAGTISAIIGGAAGFSKTTNGILILSGLNTFTGAYTEANGAGGGPTYANTLGDATNPGSLGQSGVLNLESASGSAGVLVYTGPSVSRVVSLNIEPLSSGGANTSFEIAGQNVSVTFSGTNTWGGGSDHLIGAAGSNFAPGPISEINSPAQGQNIEFQRVVRQRRVLLVNGQLRSFCFRGYCENGNGWQSVPRTPRTA